MIIDLILDRKDGYRYNPREFYDEVIKYGETWPDIAFPIASAMDSGIEQDVKNELCRYVIEYGYNSKICEYINSVEWLN